jgi:hypothetical protein
METLSLHLITMNGVGIVGGLFSWQYSLMAKINSKDGSSKESNALGLTT